MIYVLGPGDKCPDNIVVVNTTSRSKEEWSRGLSPFFLGPVPLYDKMWAQNVENAWQYSKVYKKHVDSKGDPTKIWFAWSRAGFSRDFADRYPMGKGAKPLYSYWNGTKLIT